MTALNRRDSRRCEEVFVRRPDVIVQIRTTPRPRLWRWKIVCREVMAMHRQVNLCRTNERALPVTEFVAHYHRERNHQGLENALIDGEPTISAGPVRRQSRLGGLLNFYKRAA
jgi:hypothetical protein